VDSDLRLRPVGEDDLAIVYRLTSDPAATGEHEWFGWQDPWRYRRRWEENGLLGQDSGMLIVADGEAVLGFVSWQQRPTARTSFCLSIGIALNPDARGRGHGTQAHRLLVRYLFMHTQVNRIEASTEVTNLAEQRVLEKAGFTREGIIRGAGFQGGRWHDGVSYSILRHEVAL
jgi:RimJ/RimL family protein N-acetyltransferase